MKLRRGDTLIEVALALGIFSMVAISIVSVVSASTSGAQSSLETTVAREEVDVQAEALRFIHDSYIAGGQSNSVNNDRYRELWRAITGSAKNKADSLTFNPTTCKELYDGSALQDQGAFIINPRNLGLINTEDRSLLDDAINQIVIRPPVNATDNGVFFAPTTYPRLLYGAPSQTENQLNNQSLLALTASDDANLRRAEGIYVVAIQDGETTAIVNQNGTVKRAAYYDFYIRTCWFAPGADRPSSVSTVIRL